MPNRPKRSMLLGVSAAVTVLTLAFAIFLGPSLTIRGVPIAMIFKFLQDEPARDAYFSGNKQELHARLQQLGIEEEIKAFYRPQIPDEVELDQHIHQIFYDSSGYVGKAYRVDDQGALVLIDRYYERWYDLAYEAGVVVDSRYENGTYYVTSPDGTVAPYLQVAQVFPVKVLQQLIQLNQQSSTVQSQR